MSGGALLGSARGCCGMAILLLSLVLSSVIANDEVHLNVLGGLDDSGNEDHEEHVEEHEGHGAEPADAVLFPR